MLRACWTKQSVPIWSFGKEVGISVQEASTYLHCSWNKSTPRQKPQQGLVHRINRTRTINRFTLHQSFSGKEIINLKNITWLCLKSVACYTSWALRCDFFMNALSYKDPYCPVLTRNPYESAASLFPRMAASLRYLTAASWSCFMPSPSEYNIPRCKLAMAKAWSAWSSDVL